MPVELPTTRSVLRTVLAVVAVALILYLIYLLRTPIGWLVIAAFVAIATGGPVAYFSRWMKRGFAIALVYVSIVLFPILLGALLVPPMVTQFEELASNIPQYAADLSTFVDENDTLRGLNEEFDVTATLQQEAQTLPSRIGDAAGILQDIGVGLVNSIFAGVTIFILSIFMVAGGRRWIERIVASQNPRHAERLRRTLDETADAVGNYIIGAVAQATIAGVTAFTVLTALGVPFAGPLALLVAIFDLIPVVGATIAAVFVAVVTLFVNFPIALIIWIVYAIVYQQIENYVIQPQIQKRAVEVEPFFILVAVLFGATLFGIIGALLAIPAAATIQIITREALEYRREIRAERGNPLPKDSAAEAPAS
jgi:predicted PurR-regulated permease PerM